MTKIILDITRFFRAKLSIFFDQYENLSSKFDNKICIKTKKLSKLIIKKNSNKKKTHRIFSQKVLNLIINDQLKDFLQKGFIQQMFFIHNRLFLYNQYLELKNSTNWKFWKKILIEDKIGSPVRYFLKPWTSGNRIHHAYHLKKFCDHSKKSLKEFDYIFEFGGGYGLMAKIFKKINKKSTYIIFDTAEVSLIQYYYLERSKIKTIFNSVEKGKVCLINDIKILKKIFYKIKKNNSEKIFYIANWSLSEVPMSLRKKINYMINHTKYILISFQKKFENINNYIYFQNQNNKISKKKVIETMKHKKGNFYCLYY